MGELNRRIKERVLSERRNTGNVLAAAPQLNPTFTYSPFLALDAVLEEERSGVLIKRPEDIADLDMDWREDMAKIRERLHYQRDLPKYPSDMRPS